jgi:hypothetical protein
VPSRFERRPITGARGGEVNEAGIAYKHGKKMLVSKNIAGLPTIDLGKGYIGPIRPSGEYYFEDDSGSATWDTDRLLEEIVCYEFHGAPQHGFKLSWVHHLDGDDNNNHADNLCWMWDPNTVGKYAELVIRGHMRPDFLPLHVWTQYATPETRRMRRYLSDVTWVGAPNLPGWMPLSLQR